MKIRNLSIQVIPINTENAYTHIDAAIEVIQSLGLNYEVTPFSAVVEGSLEALQHLISIIQQEVFTSGAEEVILNIQIHSKKSKDVFLNEKTHKFHWVGNFMRIVNGS